MTKYAVEVCLGDGEYNQDFTLEFDSMGEAEDASNKIENASNVLYTEITEYEGE